MSTAQVIAQLQAASAKLDEASSKITAAREDAAHAGQLVGVALQGSSGQLASMINQLVEALGQISTRPTAAKEHVQNTITKVQALGN